MITGIRKAHTLVSLEMKSVVSSTNNSGMPTIDFESVNRPEQAT